MLLALIVQDGGEALYRKIEEALLGAKTLQLKYRVVTEARAGKDVDKCDVSGELAMKSNGRLRFDFRGTFLEADVKGAVACDGKTLRVTVGEKAKDRPAPADLGKEFARLLVRGGLSASFSAGFAHLQTSVAEWKLSDWRELEPEKLGERECRRLQFTVDTGLKKEQFVAKLWVDAATLVPVKRVVKGGDDAIEIVITETWEGAKLDGGLADEDFEFEK